MGHAFTTLTRTLSIRNRRGRQTTAGGVDRGTTTSTPAREDFTGHERDAATQLHYAGARYYMSALGRWTTTDPILGEQTPAQLLKDGKVQPFSMSAYTYSFNNPVNLQDASGKWPTPDTVLDLGFLAYSAYDVARTALRGETVSSTQWAALAADGGSLLIPGMTGGGAAVRAASRGDEVANLLTGGGKLFAGSGSRTTLEGVEQFMKRNADRINTKIGKKLAGGKLPFEISKAGSDKAIQSIRETLGNVSKVSDPFVAKQSKMTVVDVFSEKTGMTVRIAKETGEFRTLIPNATSNVK